MKNLICLSVFIFLFTAISAQDNGNVTLPISDKYGIMITPAEYLSNGSPVLNFVSDNRIALYNSDLTLNAEFDCTKTEKYLYSITYTRNVTNVRRTSLTVEPQPIKMYDETLTREEMIERFIEEEKIYGAQISYFVDGDDVFFIGLSPFMETEMYYGDRTPLAGVLLRGNSIYRFRAEYEADYTDWVESGRKELDLEYRAVQIACIGTPTGFIASQTLFDDDNEFEYVIPQYGNIGELPSQTYESTRPITTKTEYTGEKNCITGYKILSASGTEKQVIKFSSGYYVSEYDTPYLLILDLDGNKYAVTECRKNGEYNDTRYYDFYRLTKSAGLQKVNVEPLKMSVVPTMVRNGEPINITLPNNAGKKYSVTIDSTSGQRIATSHIPAGENQIQINAPQQSGMHIITVTDGTSTVGSQKIIVR